MNTITQEIFKRTSNIGSLVIFLKKNEKYTHHLNENIPIDIIDRQLSEKVYYFINNIKITKNCKCGKHLKFIGFKIGYRKTCGDKKCVSNSRKETCIVSYGVDNPKKSDIVKDKIKDNILKKWNGKHYMRDDRIISKFKKTMLDKYGVEWAQQSECIKIKSSETWNNNLNKKNIINDRSDKIRNKSSDQKKEINDKKVKSIIEKFGSYDNFIDYRLDMIKKSSKDKFGLDHHLMSDIVIKKRTESYRNNITNKIISKLPKTISYIDRVSNTNITDNYIKLKCLNCDTEFSITRQLLENRILSEKEVCLNCNPIKSGTSQKEIDVLDFIKSKYNGDIINRYKIKDTEIDIYLPQLKIGFEFNGLYWHSEECKEKYYHLEKTLKCKELDIDIFHIWEDDWDNKNEIVKSMILNKIKLTPNRIMARLCDVRVISDNSIIRNFLNRNHIQGFVGSRYKIGLYYKDELVSIMTFGNLRVSLGQRSIEGSYELLRFCNKLDTSVIGGASRLFINAIEFFNINEVISYADYSRSIGQLYSKLGFDLVSTSDPNYYYIIDGMRKHRFNYRKDKLIKMGYDINLSESQIMKSLNIYKIWDCGMLKFKKNIK
jgi:hypothetical protein